MTPDTLHLPPGASNFAADYNWLFYFVYWSCVAFFLLVTVITIAFFVKYRHKGGPKTFTPGITHNTALEIFWTTIPTILILFMFWKGFNHYMDYWVAPKDAYVIHVHASQWSWTFEYDTPDGIVQSEHLVVPEGRPVKLLMSSNDVLHSLFIPDFRVKMDVIPRRTTNMWFEPLEGSANTRFDADAPSHLDYVPAELDENGEVVKAAVGGYYDLFCSEYCGQKHSKMQRRVHVLPPAEFSEWLEKESKPSGPLWEIGAKQYKVQGCFACHSVDGGPGAGPTWKGQFGTEREVVENGATITVAMDEAYIHESIREPHKKLRTPYGPQMPANPGITEDQIRALTAYIASLGENFNPNDWGGVPGEGDEESAPDESPEGDAPVESVPTPAP